MLTQREFLSIAARLPWMTLGELEALLEPAPLVMRDSLAHHEERA